MILDGIVQQLIIGVPIFLVIFWITWISLKSVSIFGTTGNISISICVVILCVASMFNFMSPGTIAQYAISKDVSQASTFTMDSQGMASIKPQMHKNHRIILLPYFALLVAIIGALLVWLLAKISTVCNNIFLPSSSSIWINKKYSTKKKQITKAGSNFRFIRQNPKN